tara:strand:+ start:10829 stop:11350 length:522 start_codon:yes stop_codon:yes gene_type:complete
MKKDASPQRTQFIMMFFAFAFGMILSNVLSTQSAKSSNKSSNKSPQEILFIYRGTEKTLNDIIESDRTQISELNDKKIKLIENAALRQYFSDEAKQQGLDIESAVKKTLRWDDITESEINDFYLTNKGSIQKPLFEVRSQIKKNLELKRARYAREKLLEGLKIKGDLAILPSS